MAKVGYIFKADRYDGLEADKSGWRSTVVYK